MDHDKIRASFRRYVADIIGIVYNNFVYQVPKMKTIGLIKREIQVLEKKLGGFSPMEKSFLATMSKNIYYFVSKNSLVDLRKVEKGVDYQERIKNRSTVVFEAVKEKIIDSGMATKVMNEGIRIHESDIKGAELAKLLGPCSDYTPFVVCDVHENCAKDHLAYQGKVYYKDDWQSYVSDPEMTQKIEVYIKNHHCMSVKEVTGPKVYLVTRPYCRHNLHEIDADEVLNSSVNKIIKEHGLFKKAPKPKTDADRASRAYLDRFEIYRELWKVAPNEKLAEDINKTRKLYKKWRNQANR